MLREFFNEATVFPVPDDAPVEIPRIIIETLHEHAQLNISPVTATFEVHYNDGFEKTGMHVNNILPKECQRFLSF